MKLTEALVGTHFAGAERGSASVRVLILRRQHRFHLSRITTDAQGKLTSQFWTFPSLYDLLLFARAQGFAKVDPDAADWQPVLASP